MLYKKFLDLKPVSFSIFGEYHKWPEGTITNTLREGIREYRWQVKGKRTYYYGLELSYNALKDCFFIFIANQSLPYVVPNLEKCGRSWYIRRDKVKENDMSNEIVLPLDNTFCRSCTGSMLERNFCNNMRNIDGGYDYPFLIRFESNGYEVARSWEDKEEAAIKLLDNVKDFDHLYSTIDFINNLGVKDSPDVARVITDTISKITNK